MSVLKKTPLIFKRHRKEIEPLLFGTGKLTLNDPTEKDNTVNPFGGTSSYQNTTSNHNNQDDDASEARTVGSTKSKNSPRSKKSKPKGYGSANRSSLWTIPTAATTTTTTTAANNGNGNGDDKENDNNSRKQQRQDGESDEDHSTVITHSGSSGRPDRPKRDWPVKVFFAIESYALMVCLGLLVSQLLPMVFVPLKDFDRGYLALKIYMCIFAVLFMIVEIDHPKVPFLGNAVFLTTYATRGFLYTFFGLVCFEEAYSEKAHKMVEDAEKLYAEKTMPIFDVSWFALVNRIAAFSLISLGVLYFLMGVCCMQRLRNRFVSSDRQKCKAYREAMAKWRRES